MMTDLICPSCKESRLVIRYRCERGEQGALQGYYAGCMENLANCPDTTGVLDTPEVAVECAIENGAEEKD